MTRFRVFLSRVLALFTKRRIEAQLDDEIQAHLDLLVEENLRGGMSVDDAHAAARREFGGVEQVKELYRDQRGLPIVDTVVQDLRFAVRAYRRTPSFTVVVVLTLALGIGANTAIFTVVDGVLLRPLPYPEADRIVSFAWLLPNGVSLANVTPLTFQYWHDHSQVFDGFAVISGGSFNLVRGEDAERVRGASATADFFKVIGVFPTLGRGFLSEECAPGAPQVTVISYGLWQHLFGGRPDAVGESINLNDRPYTVIGVMPADFRYEPAVDLWYPLQLRVDPRDRGRNYAVVGRLRSGITLEQAQSDTDRLFPQFRVDNPQHVPGNARTISLMRFQDFLIADTRPSLLVLWGAVGLVLLIACSNVVNLLLSRSAAQQRDLAIRSALGTSLTRIGQQVLIESLLLTLAGGLVGVVLAFAGVRTLVALIPGEVPRLSSVAMDFRGLWFAVVTSVVIGFAFGLLGAIRFVRLDPGVVLKASAGTGIDVFRQRLSNALVVGEVALSVILLIGAGLLAATFMQLRGSRVGFETENIVTLQLPLSQARFGSTTAVARLDRELIQAIGAIPGVSSVTTASSIPLQRGPNFIFGIEGEPSEKINYVELRGVGPDYFRTLGIPLRAGRSLTASDAEGSLPVVVVNEALARLFGNPSEALGHRIVIGRTTPNEDVPREIVGVVSNVADGQPGTRLFPTLYVPRSQVAGSSDMAAVLVRTSGRVDITPELRRVVRAIDPRLPITRIQSMKEVASTALAQRRFNMILIGAFASVALLLTIVGLYGLLSYQVVQRTREIGVRMALGAQPADVRRMIVARGLILTLVGMVIGISGSFGATRFLKALLFGVSTTSPRVYVSVAGLLLAVALLASFIPARRAIRIDPMVALRCE